MLPLLDRNNSGVIDVKSALNVTLVKVPNAGLNWGSWKYKSSCVAVKIPFQVSVITFPRAGPVTRRTERTLTATTVNNCLTFGLL